MAKKYIITDKETDRIIAMCKQLGIIEENNYWHSILNDTAYPCTTCYAYNDKGQLEEGTKEVGNPIEIPTEVKVEKYCYTAEDGFFENPDWEEPTES